MADGGLRLKASTASRRHGLLAVTRLPTADSWHYRIIDRLKLRRVSPNLNDFGHGQRGKRRKSSAEGILRTARAAHSAVKRCSNRAEACTRYADTIKTGGQVCSSARNSGGDG